MIKHIVFDFGGVLLDTDGVHTGYPDDLAVIFQLPIEQTKELWSHHKTSVMIGQETPKEFLTRMKKELDLPFNLDEGIQLWEQRNAISPDRIDWQLVNELARLKPHYKIHMLTDQIQLTNGASAWIHKLNQYFDTILRSYEQGVRKPFPAAYQNLLTKIEASTEPDSVVFIDDNQANIEAANAVGIRGILYSFKDHLSLTKHFDELGISLSLTGS